MDAQSKITPATSIGTKAATPSISTFEFSDVSVVPKFTLLSDATAPKLSGLDSTVSSRQLKSAEVSTQSDVSQCHSKTHTSISSLSNRLLKTSKQYSQQAAAQINATNALVINPAQRLWLSHDIHSQTHLSTADSGNPPMKDQASLSKRRASEASEEAHDDAPKRKSDSRGTKNSQNAPDDVFLTTCGAIDSTKHANAFKNYLACLLFSASLSIQFHPVQTLCPRSKSLAGVSIRTASR